MKTQQNVLGCAIYAVEAISSIVGIGLVALGDYQEITYGIAVLCVAIGMLLLFYGHIRAASLQQALPSTARLTPPGRLFSFGWSMVVLSLILLAVNML